jgi:hypothetical protein
VTESGGGELLKRDCPMKRHLKVIMVFDGNEEEEDTHIWPIMCVELLSGGNFLVALRKAKLGHSGHSIIWTIRGVEWKLMKTNLDQSKNW